MTTGRWERQQMRKFVEQQERRQARIALGVVLVLTISMVLAGVLSPARAQIPQNAEAHRAEMTRSAYRVFGPSAPVADLAGHIHTESAWRESARSPVGAQGLGQFMPATAQDMADRFPAECAPADPYSPSWAFRCRDRYIKSLIDATQPMNGVPLTECQLWWLGFKDYNGGAKWTRRQRAAAAVAMADPNDPLTLAAFLGGKEGRDKRIHLRSLSNHIENTLYAPRIYTFARRYEAAGWGRSLDCL